MIRVVAFGGGHGLAASLRALRLVRREGPLALPAVGTVHTVRLSPATPRACPQAVTAIDEADWLIFGPGSWYTSVIPHLLVPEFAKAIESSPAKRLVTLNLAAEKETLGLSLPDHLAA